jgi:hypothetical protein
MFANLHHYFDWCALVEKQWRAKVNINPKTNKVNNKLREWHRKNPDGQVVNLAQRRIQRGQKAAGYRVGAIRL